MVEGVGVGKTRGEEQEHDAHVVDCCCRNALTVCMGVSPAGLSCPDAVRIHIA